VLGDPKLLFVSVVLKYDDEQTLITLFEGLGWQAIPNASSPNF